MITYRQSGTFGDTIYSLSVAARLKKPGKFFVHLFNVEGCARAYGYREEHISNDHRHRYTQEDYNLLAPLLQRQPYITEVATYDGSPITYDLDKFRGIWNRTMVGNYLEIFAHTFDCPYSLEPWLECDPIKEATVVINRSERHHSDRGDLKDTWHHLLEISDAKNNGIFVGTPHEHEKFVQEFGVPVKYRPVKDLLEMANLIGGADLFIGNQSSAYSIAVGIGATTVLERRSGVVDAHNECYFDRGPKSHYF